MFSNKKMVCTRCLSQEGTKKKMPGSLAITLVLLFFFFIPGILYEIWRMTSKKTVCCSCESTELIPLESERAQRLLSADKDAS